MNLNGSNCVQLCFIYTSFKQVHNFIRSYLRFLFIFTILVLQLVFYETIIMELRMYIGVLSGQDYVFNLSHFSNRTALGCVAHVRDTKYSKY